MTTRRTLALVPFVLAAALAAPSAHAAARPFDPVTEASNFSITLQRPADFDTPAYQSALLSTGLVNNQHALAAQLADPERSFTTDLCWSGTNGCAGDIRLYDWATNGYGIVRPVVFTARNGASLSGHVWATVAGPSKRPGVVITNGSVQADEQMYWYAAQTLAKAGYVVLTFDPQGQGQSDTFGEGLDAAEGFPSQTDGRPFYDGTEDAVNFFVSTRRQPYVPVPSCSTGTSHAAKQDRRAASGLSTAYNPFWQLLDRSRLGLAGHSYGAAGVSYIAQWDPRIDAVVAWDNLGGADPNSGSVPGTANRGLGEQPCPADPSARAAVPITKPGLGISADYGLPAVPNVSAPDPLGKSTASLAYSAAGVDTGEIVIRGGTHLDFSYIPTAAFGASLRGADLAAWYTTAWFDKYVKGSPSADRRLLSDRWRADAPAAAVDPHADGNVFSFYYRSRLAITRADGTPFRCENLRARCAGMTRTPGAYGYVDVATRPDRENGPGARIDAPGPNGLYFH